MTLLHFPLLSLLIWLPIVTALVVLLISNDECPNMARSVALASTVISLLLCIPLYQGFATHTYAMQFTEHVAWIPSLNINYSLGVDGISIAMIILTVFIAVVVMLAAWQSIKHQVGQYLIAFLLLQGLTIGMFAATDAILFYVFWEATLIPMYISIGVWGSQNRSYASIKFFLYTFFGSALMLVALLYLHRQSHSFTIADFYNVPLTMTTQILIFISFFLAFAVKIPMWPVHTWLPDAHTEAPAGGSVVLAALMLKMGAYGFLRFSLPIAPDAASYFAWPMIILSLIAIVYIGLVALVQDDMKKLIAYSSIAHMGFVTLGCFMIYIIIANTGDMAQAYMSLEGGMVQMVAHAFSSGAMFLGIGVLYDRLHTRSIAAYGGVAYKMPIFAALFMVFALANAGLPGTSGFVGEFMVILSTLKAQFWVTMVTALTVILGAAYTLWMYKRVFLGQVASAQIDSLQDVTWLEGGYLLLLALMVLALGLYPQVLLNLFHASVGHLFELSHISKL